MFDEKKWREYVKLADHYKAIGQTKIYLMRDDDHPWEFAIACEPGGTFRLSTPVTISFTANHVTSGLEFHWSLDLEQKDASGSGEFHIDTPHIVKALARLPKIVADQFREQLRITAIAVRQQADEWRNAADRQYHIARELEAL